MTRPVWLSAKAAKAWNAGIGAGAAGVLSYLAAGGLPALAAMTAGEWLTVAVGAAVVGVTAYNTPNAATVAAPAAQGALGVATVRPVTAAAPEPLDVRPDLPIVASPDVVEPAATVVVVDTSHGPVT